MLATLTIPQPHRGPQGQPYLVRARYADRIIEIPCWCDRSALDARDAAYEAGAWHVQVFGLACVGVCVVPANETPLAIEED